MKRRDSYRDDLRSYAIGLGAALALSALPFAAVAWHVLPRTGVLWIIAVAAVVQVVAHFRFFLHIDLSKSKRDDLQLILFSTLLVVIMAGGTIWIINNQYDRMMPGMQAGMNMTGG